MSRAPATALAVSVAAIVLISIEASADWGGEAGRSTGYDGRLEMAGDPPRSCGFSVEIERVGFLLNSVQGKYKLVRVRVENEAPAAIQLSAERDRILAHVDGNSVRGRLDLQREDPSLWDALNADLRETLAYPAAIEAAGPSSTRGAGRSVRYVYVFFPAEKLTGLPESFEYSITSSGMTVHIDRAHATRP